MGNRIKPNVLMLALLGALVVVTLAVVFPDSPAAVLAAGGALIGGFGTVMKELVAPDPPDAPEAVVPAGVVVHLIDRLAPEIAKDTGHLDQAVDGVRGPPATAA